jgi:hypothetical protein
MMKETREATNMATTRLSGADVARARQIWAEYQKTHDVSDRRGQTAGIDPVSGTIWLGTSIADVVEQMQASGLDTPLYFARVGYEYYYRKGHRL